MKFEEILEINKNLEKIKKENKKFNFELANILVDNLKITDEIVEVQNEKLNKLLLEIGVFDGYDYVIPIDNKILNKKYQDLYDEDIDCVNLQKLTFNDVSKCEFDLTTIELLKPIIKKHEKII